MSDHDDRVEVEELEASGLFDGAWYLLQNEDVRGSDLTPLLHFSRFGWREGRRPNAYFDPAWYLERYPDVSAADINPLLHYLRHGENEGRRPSWHFDPAWYRAAYDLPADAVVLAHFLTQRTSGRFAPEPELWAVLRHIAMIQPRRTIRSRITSTMWRARSASHSRTCVSWRPRA
jgi:hypothetical protein